MNRNDHRAFGMGDLVRSPETVPTLSPFEKAQAEYEAKKKAEALAKVQRDEEYQKIKTYSIIGASVLSLVAVVLFLRKK